MLNLVLILLTTLAVVMALAAPSARQHRAGARLLARGTGAPPLVRWMLISTVIFGVSGIVMGVLNSFQHFLLPALAPILYNLSIIAGAWFLAPKYGVFGLVLGVIVGRGPAPRRAVAGAVVVTALAISPTLGYAIPGYAKLPA